MPELIASVEGVEIMRVSLKNARTTLGRKRHNDIVFDNLVVSGEHCAFELEGIANVFIEDLGSTNGTYVNGHMIRSRHLLRDQDAISIGNFKVQFFSAVVSPPRTSREETRTMDLESIGFPGTSGVLHACLKVMNGSSAGLEVPVVKAVTTFGQPGISVVSLSHRRDGYYVSYMEGTTPALLNGKQLGKEARMLAHRDVLDLAGTGMEFLLVNT